MKRRSVLAGLAAALTAGCSKIGDSRAFTGLVDGAEKLHRGAHRLIGGRRPMAREYSPAEISPYFRGNGNTQIDSEVYRAHAGAAFAHWVLEVRGLVERPLILSMAQLRALPQRTQITRHDCVEGWSSIGKWTGARLGPLLAQARLKREARYIAFFCADTLELTLDGTGDYYETIDLVDAFHPQTILAYDKNDGPLPVAHGAPLRLRVERQLGYKMAKYVMRIEAVESFAQLGQGKGGYWEDRGYQWYAGI